MSKKCECSVGTPNGPVPCQHDAVITTADRSYCSAHYARWVTLSDEQKIKFANAWRRYKENSQPAPLSEDSQQPRKEDMQTRSHYRNSMLAFPKTAEYGCAIERPMRRFSWTRFFIVFMFLMALAYYFNW